MTSVWAPGIVVWYRQAAGLGSPRAGWPVRLLVTAPGVSQSELPVTF